MRNYIKSLNFGYRIDLSKNNVKYENAFVNFLDSNTISATYVDKTVKTFTSKDFVIAVGGRPYYPESILGAELAISSDDIFTLQNPPGKTLIVGASCKLFL